MAVNGKVAPVAPGMALPSLLHWKLRMLESLVVMDNVAGAPGVAKILCGSAVITGASSLSVSTVCITSVLLPQRFDPSRARTVIWLSPFSRETPAIDQLERFVSNVPIPAPPRSFSHVICSIGNPPWRVKLPLRSIVFVFVFQSTMADGDVTVTSGGVEPALVGRSQTKTNNKNKPPHTKKPDPNTQNNPRAM